LWGALAVSFALLLSLAGGISQDALGQNAEVIVRIDVDDRGEDSIDRAAREALESVLLKRSGDRALLTHPSVSAALDTARSNLSLTSSRESRTEPASSLTLMSR